MICIMKNRYLLCLLLFSLLFSVFTVIADNDDFEGGEIENDAFEGTGVAAFALMFMGFSYVLLKRTYIYSQRYLKEDQKELKGQIKDIYRKTRKPLMVFHFLVNIIATILAFVHGFMVFDFTTLKFSGESGAIFTGIVAATAMLILSVSGYIIWQRVALIWENKATRKLTMALHRQWLFTIILLVSLIFHMD